MRPELMILAWGAVLLLVHILLPARLLTKERGIAWNMGARDEPQPAPGPMAGRLTRARDNYLETLPIAILAFLGVVVAGRADEWTAAGGWIWLAARVVYLPLYAAGVPVARTVVWSASLVGLAMALWPLLWA